MSVQILSRQESKTVVFVKKTGLFAILLDIRGALDRYLKAPPYNNKKRFSICDKALFSEANKTLNSYLKQPVKETRKDSRDSPQNSLGSPRQRKLCEKGELGDVLSAICQFTFNVTNSG